MADDFNNNGINNGDQSTSGTSVERGSPHETRIPRFGETTEQNEQQGTENSQSYHTYSFSNGYKSNSWASNQKENNSRGEISSDRIYVTHEELLAPLPHRT